MRLLVAVDFSNSSETVISGIESRPWPAGTEARVLNVLDITSMRGLVHPGTVIEEQRYEAHRLADALAARLYAAEIDATSDVILDLPRSAIPAYAKQWCADFIILGSHRHTDLIRFLLGSVAGSVLRKSTCSVEIVRAAPASVGSPDLMKVLLATDGSSDSQAAARSIASRPWPPGSEFKVVCFADLPPFCLPPDAAVEHDSTLDGLRDEIIGKCDEAVEFAQSTLEGAGLDSLGAVTVGDPGIGIMHEASRWGARLIVLGSHGVNGAYGMLPGTTAETVALHSHTSVEIIRPAESLF